MRIFAVFPLLCITGFVISTPGKVAASPAERHIHLKVDAGTPLRVYLAKRLPVRLDQPVNAILLEPVYSFDRVVIPAGSKVSGKIIRLDPISRTGRMFAMFAGDFTPLHSAEVRFYDLTFPDSHHVSLNTSQSLGLPLVISAVRAPKKTRPKKNKPNDDRSGIQSKVHTAVTREIHNQINTRTHGMADIVRGPGKLERLEEFLLAKLPYHPQWVRKGTRYDAVLNQPLDFGEIAVKPETLRWIGSPLSGGVHAQARLLNALNSRETKQGRQFKAKLIEPLFSADHHLLLPEGTDLEGVVTQARPARLFHRGGQLRFRFERVQLPDAVLKAEAQLDAVEGDSSAKLKVDQEGGVKSTDSKTRLLNPVIAGLIAAKSMDNDEGKASQDANYSGRTLGGGSGFGLLGILAAQSSRYAGSAFGFYGLGWSVYRNVIARGQEVDFRSNTAMDVRFQNRDAHDKPEGQHLSQLRDSGR